MSNNLLTALETDGRVQAEALLALVLAGALAFLAVRIDSVCSSAKSDCGQCINLVQHIPGL